MKSLLKSLLYFFLKDRMYILLNKRRFYLYRGKMLRKAKKYNCSKNKIIELISNKDKIRILFFVYNLGMWKYEGLVRLLLSHPKFEPIIVPFAMPENRPKFNRYNQECIINYCKDNNFPFKIGYDACSNEYNDLEGIDPDIVVYTQPYNTGYEKWRIDRYLKNCLFIYTPYGLSVTNDKVLYDTYLNNIAWKIFVSSPMEKAVLQKAITTKINIVVTGATLYDQLNQAYSQKSPWRNNRKKRVIWAPHHSMDSKYSFSSSNFERICSDMIMLANKFQDTVEFAFKPHPILKERLIEKWGKERADSYYTLWESMPNTMICLGAYTELFAFSDAMIHDCASFVGEYLYTNKPVMYIYKDRIPPASVDNEFGIGCFNCHYHGHSTNDIEEFITNVVLRGEDTMKDKRGEFAQTQLFPPNNLSTAENMLNELEELLIAH